MAELHGVHVEAKSSGRVLQVRTGRGTFAERVVQMTNLDAIWDVVDSDDAPPG